MDILIALGWLLAAWAVLCGGLMCLVVFVTSVARLRHHRRRVTVTLPLTPHLVCRVALDHLERIELRELEAYGRNRQN